MAVIAAVAASSASAATLVFYAGTPPKGYLGQQYAYGIAVGTADHTAVPQPLTWQVSGQLPPGLSLVPDPPSNATIEGKPKQAGTFPFDVTATDGLGDTVTHHFSITIDLVDTRPVNDLVDTVIFLANCLPQVLNPLNGLPFNCLTT